MIYRSKWLLTLIAMVVTFTSAISIVSANSSSSNAVPTFTIHDSSSSSGKLKVSSTNGDQAWIEAVKKSGNEIAVTVFNKSADTQLVGIFNVTGGKKYTSATVQGVDRSSGTVKQLDTIASIADNRFVHVLPPLTGYVITAKAALPTPGQGSGLRGTYYNTKDFKEMKVTRIDPTVAFDWGTGSPDTSIHSDTFSVRWSGQIEPQFTEEYTFYTSTDDGVRLWVDGKKLIDDWKIHSAKENKGSIRLVAGKKYDIKLEYFEHEGLSSSKLSWSSASQSKQIIPQQQLYPSSAPAPNPGNGDGLKGEYYDEKNFTQPKLTRLDGTINFDWKRNAPASSVGADTFSVRWTGKIQPLYSEQYTFHTLSDDGVRLWVNGQLLIQDWNTHGVKENTGKISLAAGQQYDIILEYFDETHEASVQLLWSSSSQAKQIVPQSQLYSGLSYPERPTGLKATPGNAQVVLTWNAADRASSYEIKRSTNLDGPYVKLAQVSGTTYTDQSAKNGTRYYYVVNAMNAKGASGNSYSVNAKPSS